MHLCRVAGIEAIRWQPGVSQMRFPAKVHHHLRADSASSRRLAAKACNTGQKKASPRVIGGSRKIASSIAAASNPRYKPVPA